MTIFCYMAINAQQVKRPPTTLSHLVAN